MIKNLDVFLWGDKVGTLVAYKERYTEKVCFYFDEDFQKKRIDIAPLTAPVNRNFHLPVFPEADKVFGGLPSFIADSLPDHWGDRVFAEWAKANGIRQRDLSPLDKLAYIGRRGMGAFEFVPSMAEEMERPFKVEIAKLQDLAIAVQNEAKGFRAEIGKDIAIESLFKVGTSAGGRRPKAIININLETGECLSGQVPAPEGFTPSIIKFDERQPMPTTRIEYAYHLMALEAGLRMMPSRLMETDGSAHFITQRFDRLGAEKLHVQTLAAICPASTSYEELFETAARIGVPPLESAQIFLAMLMNVLCSNVDDHNKNFSFLMARDGQWHIAPAYDFTFTTDPSAPFYANRHSLTVNGKNDHIQLDDVLAIAKAFDIKSTRTKINAAVNAANTFARHAATAGIDTHWTNIVQLEIAERINTFNS